MSTTTFTLDPHTRQKITPLMHRIRDDTLRRGENALRMLGKDLGCKTKHSEVKMTNDELKKALYNFGIVLSVQEVNQIHAAFRDEVGYILVHHFFNHLKDTLNARRRAVVDQAFATMDKDGSGLLTVDDLKGRYSAAENPLVLRGERTEEDILHMFLSHFDDQSNPDGTVTKDEFERYYAAVSASIPDDEYFEVMMANAWKLNAAKKDEVKKKIFVPEATVTRKDDGSQAFAKPKRVAGYTGHVPLAQERYGETFHQIESQTPELKKKPQTWLVGSYVDEGNAFVRKGNKANAHSFKMA